MLTGQIYPATTPGCEFVHDSGSWVNSTLGETPLTLVTNAQMYRRKIWWSFAYYGAADANFMIDAEVQFSYKGERIFALPVQYNARQSTANNSPVDVFWSSHSTPVNPASFILNDEPIMADITGSSIFLGANPFRGTFICDKIQLRVFRKLLTGTERMYAFLACQSEYPY